METKTTEKRYFFFGLLLVTAFLSFLIFKPFISIIVIAGAIAVSLHPLYGFFKKKMNSGLASFLTMLFFLVVLCVPLFGAGSLVVKESRDVYQSITKSETDVFIKSFNRSINSVLPKNAPFDLREQAASFISFISDNAAKVFTSTLSAIFSFFLVFVMIFYFLKDGDKWKRAVVAISPLSDRDDDEILEKLKRAMDGIIKGSLFVALMQGTFMGLGLWLFGVPNPALWGMVAAVTSLVPMAGTAVVSIPAIIFLFASGNVPAAIGLLAWSVALVGMIDNILSPLLVGTKINLSPIIVLFSVLGGIVLLGPSGGIVGPVIISLLYALVSIYRNEFKPK